jgi:hypothetical protein
MDTNKISYIASQGLTIDIAIRIWISDEGYRKINSYLSQSKSRSDYIYHQTDNININYEGKNYKTIDVINTIKSHMKESNVEEIYYRGGSENSKKSFVKKTFISVTTDIEQAESFVDGDCCLFKILVDPSVKRYNTGVENEVLLENNLYWNYINKENNYYIVHISKENNQPKNIIEKTNLTEEELNTLLNDYKEECDLLDVNVSPQGLIDYITSTTTNKKSISIEKAKKLLGISVGGNKNKKTNKNYINKKRKTNKKYIIKKRKTNKRMSKKNRNRIL